MQGVRLRTKFLLSLVAITAALSAATLLIVSYRVKQQARKGLGEDLATSVKTYQIFDAQREDALERSAALLASFPRLKALMTTDAETIQEESGDFLNLSGSDLLVLAGRTGELLALQPEGGGLSRNRAQQFVRASLQRGEAKWWYGGGHLYEVWIQPISLSADSNLGYLVVGHEINHAATHDFSSLAASEIAFEYAGAIVASTLPADLQSRLQQKLTDAGRTSSLGASGASGQRDLRLGREEFLASTVSLSGAGGPAVSLTVLKSLDRATSYVSVLNRVLLLIGLLSVLAGSILVYLISDTFTRPLASLVAGVRALDSGDYTYPLAGQGGDEVSEVTGAFVRMRANLHKTQGDQRQLEERLRQAHKMEAVGRLAGGVAHDFNNLLTVINGNSDLLLERDGADDFHRRCVEQIQKAARRAVGMTRQLLAFSRMQVLQPRIMDLNSVIAEMGKMLPRLIGEHIEYEFLADRDLPSIKADAGQIEQVVMNLAVNARDAMPEGGKLVVRTASVVLDEAAAALHPPVGPGAYVVLSVQDNGCGMDEDTKAHIFEPFFTTKEVGKGTGLGLATVYGIVKQSGGFICVESSRSRGATFDVYLPHAHGAVSAAESEPKAPSIPRGSETILVVEDEGGVRELACQFLRAKGYSVVEARDGMEALELAGHHGGTIQLVLTDVVMPRLSGAEMARRLKPILPDAKFVFMSGYAQYSNGDHAVLPGPVLQKPFSAASLVGMIREVLAGSNTEVSSGGAEVPRYVNN